ncbi:hypothetical protein QE152_g26127 [Popillia japonica]|uniref:Uncharacterized protein n=1 Tax=Popillia japonica TaxID=7064 RepID=A0AAW1JZG9_POPJA
MGALAEKNFPKASVAPVDKEGPSDNKAGTNTTGGEATFLYLLAPVDKEGPSDNKAGTNTTGGVFYHSSCLYAKEFLDYTGISWTNI